MIVDDDESVRSLLRMTLPEDGYEIDEATDGEQALALVEERVPDLVLLDWKMPGRHGSLVLDELKSRHPELPVIVLTAEIAQHHRNLAESLNVDVFLTKPFSPLELLETIERLIGEHRPETP
jgi:two-component system, OmpR family, phosphate regulon response regulator PhoB